MIPLRLEIEGFLSYKDKQLIDFEKLFSTRVFIIHGRTGAGKSSILDSITFALYGRIPRFGREKAGELVINHNCKRAVVSLEVEARDPSGKQRIYKITRVVEKISSSKKTSELELKFRYPDDDHWHIVRTGSISEGEKFIEEKILGIPYDIFTKTVILPQNRFADFLLSTPAERTAIILKLTGFDDKIEAIKKIISEKIKNHKLNREKYESKIKELESINQNLILKIQNEINKISSQLNTKEKRREEIEEELKKNLISYNNITELINSVERAIETINSIKDKKKSITDVDGAFQDVKFEVDKVKNLKDLFRALLVKLENSEAMKISTFESRFSNTLNKLKELNSLIISEIKNLKEKISLVSKMNNEKAEIKNKLKKIEERISGFILEEPELQIVSKAINNLKIALRDEELISKEEKEINNKIENITKKNSSLQSSIDEERWKAAKISEELKFLEEQIEKARLDNKVSLIRSKLKDGDICPVCENIFRRKEKWKSEEQIKSIIIENIEEKYKEKEQELKRIEKQISSMEGQIKTNKETKNDLENKLEELQKKYNEISAKKEQIVRNIAKYAEKFRGQVLEELLSEIEDPFSDYKTKELKLDLTLEKLDELIKLKREQEIYLKNLKDIEERINELIIYIRNSERLEENKNSFETLLRNNIPFLQNFISILQPALSEIDELLKSISQFNDIGNYLQNIKELIQSIMINLSDERIFSIINRFRSHLMTIENILQIFNAENTDPEIGGTRLNAIDEKIFQEINSLEKISTNIKGIADTLQNLRKHINNRVQESEKELEILNQKLQNLQLRKNRLESEIEIETKNLKELISTLSRQKSEIVFAEVEKDTLDEKLCELSETFRKIKSTLESEKESLLKTISDIENERISTLKEIQELSTAKGKKLSELELYREKLKEKEEAEKILPNIIKEIEILEEIFSDFTEARGKSELDFRNYIAGFTIGQIINHASERFEKLTGGRYSFELVNKEIKIKDSQFGVLREVKSLSGGETFIASLALSLGLAHHMIGSAKFGCFFIDEGFGSLDEESLELVSEALEKLASEGFRLGIITHVDSMKKLDFFSKMLVEKVNGHSVIKW